MTLRQTALPGLLAAALMACSTARIARADTTYSYTGNAFNDFRNGGACPPTCNVTGSFTVATPLAPELPLTVITPISFTLTSSLVTLTDGDPSGSSLAVATDASGAIVAWAWVELGPAGNIAARILTEDTPDTVADDVRLGNNAPPFVGFGGPTIGLVQNDPGIWTQTPEPSFLLPLAGVLLLAFGRARSKRLN
jgi:hypothetical protein